MFDNSSLTPFSVKVLNTLLYHQRRVRKPRVTADDVPPRMLSYGDLCEMLDREKRHAICLCEPLARIEEWCVANDRPNLSALVVSEATRRPGECYGRSPQFSRDSWEQDILDCLGTINYPLHIC
ncbi:hypothetical protein GGQ74_000510 [Desulfobaculum xiamenense]|uniref:Uncharacterized protein n=1 Tax=Desulfobaculum xiamenense TaxID=995050 RepID=A0A846QIE6_9BACT|nr:hypothetical protein [Desulfobaculum xiamenense]NJB66870.1 hypothetical protein [Desulfobaculum xiamenense]